MTIHLHRESNCARRRCRFRHALAAGLAGVALSFAIASPAAGQRTRDRDREQERWDALRPIAPTPIEGSRRGEDAFGEDVQRSRAGLLREGALMVEVRAGLLFDDETRTWYARLYVDADAEHGREPREMRLLPNSFLGEVLQVIEATPNQKITFELTGETLVYDGGSYLLLRAPARVVGLERIDVEEAAPSQARAPADLDQPRPRPRRSAAEVMRELERESGPLHRAPLVPRRPADPATPGLAVGDGRPPAPGTPDHEAVDDRRQWREGAIVIQRRGRLTRDAMGAWRFVLDADAQGLSDPPLTLMPCLLLERIERFARQAGPTEPVLMNGEVFVHDGRAYLLPSAFQLPRERTPLN